MGTFEIRDDFYLNGEKIKIISGSIHYFRVVPEYWRDRLLKLKAMGCNTVETYIAWNMHERRKGEFTFDGICDVERFVGMAHELGLYVILRPAPYICAEWEFGGLPAWLLKEDGIRLRCSDPRFMAHVLSYYDELIPRLAPLQITKGGPVIMMQVENEYGSYCEDKVYLAQLRDALIARGIEIPLVTSDGPWGDMLCCGEIDGVFRTGNFGSKAEEHFTKMDGLGINPKMCMEFWCGWFDHWGCGKHSTTSAETAAHEFDEILKRGHANIYMFHGGTNFGFMNGANDYEALAPDVTSYDYDSPLTEDGRTTEKYELFKQVIAKYRELPAEKIEIPEIQRRAYGKAKCVASAPLLDLAAGKEPVCGLHPMSMERLDQYYGYTLYRTKLIYETTLETIQLIDAGDRAQIFMDGKHLVTLYDRQLTGEYAFETPIPVTKGATLEILVENMGRVNYSYKLERQRKGIDHAVVINHHLHPCWEMVTMDEETLLSFAPVEGEATAGAPSVSSYAFDVDVAADTFLDLPGFGKGFVFINGFALGRFWEIGPQKRLYIPAPLLREGKNDLLMVETEGKIGEVVLCDEPDLG